MPAMQYISKCVSQEVKQPMLTSVPFPGPQPLPNFLSESDVLWLLNVCSRFPYFSTSTSYASACVSADMH